MFLRISSASLALLLLAGCEGEQAAPFFAEEQPVSAPGETVDCAIGQVKDLGPNCTLERVSTGEIVIHHPDGGFRRIVRDTATGALAPRDGVDPLVPGAADDGTLAFAIGPDRYAIPQAMLAGPVE